MIKLSILNLQSIIFEGNVNSLTLPGANGELTILPNHLAIITPLKKGVISATISNDEHYETAEKKYFECESGMLEFADNNATILL